MAQSIAELSQQLSDSSVEVRRGAAESLAHMAEDASPAAVALLHSVGDEDETTREFSVAALEGLGAPPAECVDELADALTSPSADTAYWAATLLGRLEGSAMCAVEALKAASAEHPAEQVQRRATWALGKIASG